MLAAVLFTLFSAAEGARCSWGKSTTGGVTTGRTVSTNSETGCQTECEKDNSCKSISYKGNTCTLHPCTAGSVGCLNLTSDGEYFTCNDILDECLIHRKTCLAAGQECRDTNLKTSGDWECHCTPPASGRATAKQASCVPTPGCTSHHVFCNQIGQECKETSNDWTCTCPAPAKEGGPLTCVINECSGNTQCALGTQCRDLNVSHLSLDDWVCVAPSAPPPPVGNCSGLTNAQCSAPCVWESSSAVCRSGDDGDDDGFPLVPFVVVSTGACFLSVGCFIFFLEKRRPMPPTPTDEPLIMFDTRRTATPTKHKVAPERDAPPSMPLSLPIAHADDIPCAVPPLSRPPNRVFKQGHFTSSPVPPISPVST